MDYLSFDPFNNIDKELNTVEKKFNDNSFFDSTFDNTFDSTFDRYFDFDKHKNISKNDSNDEYKSDKSSLDTSDTSDILDISNEVDALNKLKENYEEKSTIISNHHNTIYKIKYTNHEAENQHVYMYNDIFYENMLYCQKTFLNPKIKTIFNCDCIYYPVAQRQIINDIFNIIHKYHNNYIDLAMNSNNVTHIKVTISIKTQKNMLKSAYYENIKVLCDEINNISTRHLITIVNNVKEIQRNNTYNSKKTKQIINLLVASDGFVDEITKIITETTNFNIIDINTKSNPYIIKYISDTDNTIINSAILDYGFTNKRSTVLYNNTVHVYNINSTLDTINRCNDLNLFDNNFSTIFNNKYIYNFDADEVYLTNNIDHVLITHYENKTFRHYDSNDTIHIPFMHTLDSLSHGSIKKINEIIGFKLINENSHDKLCKNVFNFSTISKNIINEPRYNFYNNNNNRQNCENFITTINTKDTLSIVCIDLNNETIDINEHNKQILMDDFGSNMLHFGKTKSWNDKYCFNDRIIYLPNPPIKIYQNNKTLSENLYNQIVQNKYVPIGKEFLNYLKLNLNKTKHEYVMEIINKHDVNFDAINI